MDRLIFAVLLDSLAEIRRVPARCGRISSLEIEHLEQHFCIWERGVLLNAACFLLDFPQVAIEIPPGAYSVAHRIIALEGRHGYMDDLAAASIAAVPWRTHFEAECLHCARQGSWRRVLAPPADMPQEIAWRYERPENHIPLCRRCATRLVYRDPEARIDVVRALWGARFEAFHRWHLASAHDALPENWSRSLHPLWPPGFGGPSWSAGSGDLNASEPQMFYGVARTAFHRERLEANLGKRRASVIAGTRPHPDPDLLVPMFETQPGQAYGAYP